MNGGAAKEAVAIAGAGIAGLSAAIALKLAGFPVEIFEREQNPQAIGAGIQIGPNATRIMESWNLSLLGASFEPGAIELRNARSGALLNTVPLRAAALPEPIEQAWNVFRSDTVAGVGDPERHVPVLRPGAHGNATARLGEFDGVADQVLEDLEQAVVVAAKLMDEREPGACAFIVEYITRIDAIDIDLHADSVRSDAVK